MALPVVIKNVLVANPSLFAIITVVYVLASVYLYYLVRSSNMIAGIVYSKKADNLYVFFLVKIAGMTLFGIIPLLVLASYPGIESIQGLLNPGLSGQYWYILPVVFLIISLLSFFSSRKTNSNRHADKDKTPASGNLLVSVSGWLLYILGYEFLFRGILWFACYAAFGFWIAFAINIILYASAHLDQGRFMTVGAIPFGALLCFITFLTGSFLFAFLIHSWLAVNNLMFPVYSGTDPDPEMKRAES